MKNLTTSDVAIGTKSMPTIWGMSAAQIHDCYWKSRGFEVVRRGSQSAINPADAFFLIEPTMLALFNPLAALQRLYWVQPRLLMVRLSVVARAEQSHNGNNGYTAPPQVERVALTKDAEIASAWRDAVNVSHPWRLIRHQISQERRAVVPSRAIVADPTDPHQAEFWLCRLAAVWRQPDLWIDRCRRVSKRIYIDFNSQEHRRHRSEFPIWIGLGQEAVRREAVKRPTIFWDVVEATLGKRQHNAVGGQTR